MLPRSKFYPQRVAREWKQGLGFLMVSMYWQAYLWRKGAQMPSWLQRWVTLWRKAWLLWANSSCIKRFFLSSAQMKARSLVAYRKGAAFLCSFFRSQSRRPWNRFTSAIFLKPQAQASIQTAKMNLALRPGMRRLSGKSLLLFSAVLKMAWWRGEWAMSCRLHILFCRAFRSTLSMILLFINRLTLSRSYYMRFVKPSHLSKAKPGKKELLSLLTFGNDEDQLRLEQPTLALGSRSSRTRQMLQNLKDSAAFYGTTSLSANQLGLTPSVFLMARRPIRQGLWFADSLSPKDFQVYINPRIEEASSLKEYGWEYCLSFPNIRAKVLRHSSIKVSYYDEEFKHKESTLEDQEARVFQHECDHLQGYTLINLEVSNGHIEHLEEEHDTPLFNAIFEEYQQYCQLNHREPKDRLKVDRDSDPSYWDTQGQIEQKHDEKELRYIQLMHEALAQDRAGKREDPNMQ